MITNSSLNFGVIFDMDGVLVDSAAAHMESWQRLAGEMGASHVSEKQFQEVFGRRSGDIISVLFGIDDPAEIKRLDDRKESIYRDIIRGRVPAMTGAVELVKSLHEGGLRIGIGSSGPPENIELVCREMHLGSYLDAIVTGSDVQRGKPDPQVFQIAAERLGLPASACVVVEDAPAGVEAAHRAGMKCVALASSHPRELLAAANVCVNRLDQLKPASFLGLLTA